MEQLAEMVIDLQNIPTAGKINCENSGNSDLIKVKCDKCGEEFLAFLDEKYILCKKTELFGTQDANKQLNKDVKKLQSEVEKYRKAFEDTKKECDCQIAEYQKKIEELEKKSDFFFPEEPIKVADIIIHGWETSWDYKNFSISELRQIAEHLLVYCNHNKEVEE